MFVRFSVPCSLLLFLVLASSLLAQEREARPDHSERARPRIEERYRRQLEKQKLPPYIQATPQVLAGGLFLNANTTIEPANVGTPQNESSIAINPLNPQQLIACAVDYRQGLPVYLSSDGGGSWWNVNLGSVRQGWRTGNDPSVGYDHLGNAYVMYGAFPETGGGNSGIYVSRSSDHGQSWEAHMTVIEHTGVPTADTAFEDKYYIEIDTWESSPYRGRLYTPWKRVIDSDSSTTIVFSRSTDLGATWSAPIALSPRKAGNSIDTTFGQSFPIAAAGPDGTVYVAWNDGPIRSIGFVRSTDGGESFSPPQYPVTGYASLGTAKTVQSGTYHVLKGTFRAETYPTLDVDPSNSPRRGWIYLAWAAGQSPDVFFIRSTDRGATWSAPKVIHEVATNDQWWPWLSVDPTSGDIAVMYSDSRNDPANIKVDQYVSYSSDGGDTWIDRRATDFQSDFRINPFVDNIFAGDYSGNAFLNGKIYPSFLDTRNATSVPDNDVYTAVMSITQPAPVEELRARLTPTMLTQAELSWRNPDTVSLFGKPISDFTVLIARDDSVIARLPRTDTSFVDQGLALGKAFRYTVCVAAGDDTSAGRNTTIVGGGGPPLAPVIAETEGYRPQIELHVQLPARRSDSTTPLARLSVLRIYRDGALLREQTLRSTDTGRLITIEDTPPIRGYYRYHVTVLDSVNPPQVSPPSDTVVVYAGPLTQFSEDFTSEIPRYIYTGSWGPTTEASLSPPRSITDSPGTEYGRRTDTYMQLFPVAMPAAPWGLVLRFAHIVLVDPTDTAFVEVSYDRGRTFSRLATYDNTRFDGWSDGRPDPADWQAVRLVVPQPASGSATEAIVRFRLLTSIFNNADGWYIDDLSFGEVAGIGTERAEAGYAVRVEPNPFSHAAILRFINPTSGAVRVSLYDLMGRLVSEVFEGRLETGEQSVTIDGSALDAGVYLYEVRTERGTERGRTILVR